MNKYHLHETIEGNVKPQLIGLNGVLWTPPEKSISSARHSSEYSMELMNGLGSPKEQGELEGGVNTTLNLSIIFIDV